MRTLTAQLMTIHTSETSSEAPITAAVKDDSDQVEVILISNAETAFLMGAVTCSGSSASRATGPKATTRREMETQLRALAVPNL